MGQDLGFAEDSSFMNTQEFIQSTSLSSIPHYQTSIGRQPPRGLHPSQAGSIFLNPVLSSFTGSPAVSADAHLNNQQLHRPGQQQQQQVNYSPSTASQVQSPESPTTSSSTGDNLASTSAVGRRKRTKPDTDIVVSDPSAEKRRRNTLAARRFRQKQQDRVAQLERALEEVNKERDALKMQVARWEGEAMALRGMLADREKKE
ncbi:hypothetical protein AJ80_03785 [Polytolypa hystricis UAMH7299]|uniref:BZIP domain-containing protein n=1 Tax=Polytolypa hystricis (strain UAMH7299) TaxID=1447883 RepID=A0A2B7YG29_POLH7|nr:hypothetical protein AJ80_03785 [Polytolypa hystricis UAMH7299]